MPAAVSVVGGCLRRFCLEKQRCLLEESTLPGGFGTGHLMFMNVLEVFLGSLGWFGFSSRIVLCSSWCVLVQGAVVMCLKWSQQIHVNPILLLVFFLLLALKSLWSNSLSDGTILLHSRPKPGEIFDE